MLPLVKISSDFYKLITDIVDEEKDANAHKRMEMLLSGKISFEEEEDE